MRAASSIYLANGVVRWACERAFWPLLLTRLVTDLELSPLELVLLGTVYEIAIFSAEIPTGVVADVHSRRLSVIISYLLGGAAFIMSGLVSQYWLLVLSQVIVGIASTFHSGAETAWITDEVDPGADVELLILRRGQWQLVAGIVGIGLFAGLAVLLSLSAAIVATGVAMVAWGFVLTIVMSEHGFTRTEADGWSAYQAMLRHGWSAARSVRSLRILAVVVVLGGIAKEAIDRLDIARLDEIGLPSDVDEALIVGLIVMIKMLLAAILLSWMRRRLERRTASSTLVLMMTALLGCVAAGIVVLAHSDVLLIAAIALIGQGGFHAATEPIVISWTNRHAASESRATIHSFVGQGESIGEVVGGLTLGFVAQFWSITAAMTVSATLFATSALIAATARREP